MNEDKVPLHPEQKIKNYPLYLWRVFWKSLLLVFFGAGTLFFSLICLPLFRLIIHPKSKFQYYARYFLHLGTKFFCFLLRVAGLFRLKIDKKKYMQNLRSAIVVANHPAYLDSPLMIAILKHTTLVAKSSLSRKNILTILINTLFMPNSLPKEEMFARAKEDLENGNTVVIFPEGTRSTLYGQNPYKKGAARLSLETGCPVIPVYIGGNNKRGLRKGDKFYQHNATTSWHFDLYVKDPVYPEEFKDLPAPIAAKRMTQKIRDILSDEANAQYRY
ncbi:MAG: 1-acyl-sn-glycerol-3-phosphate acyltransferase [Treponema sp.]|nr:1-acyl-sn-glycerol-3-phosphate acyltransferase [Treponema sp.]